MMRPEYLDPKLFLSDIRILPLFKAVENAGGTLRVVGGAVRDALVGVCGSELDLITDLSPDELVEACNEYGLKTMTIGLKSAMTGVIINNKIYEISSLRQKSTQNTATDGYTDDWNADASKRDLTVNAIYADDKGNVFDYYDGISDLERGIIRFIGNPEERIRENPIRIIRFFRFYSKFGQNTPDAHSLSACIALKDLLRDTPIEGIRDELFKILSTPCPVPTLTLMARQDLLGYILPIPTKTGLLDRLTRLVADNHQTPDALRRLYIIYLPDEELAENLGTRLHLSRYMKKRLINWAKYSFDVSKADDDLYLKRMIFEHGLDFCIDKLLFSASCLEMSASDYTRRLNHLNSLDVPKFPLCGTDLVNLGLHDSTQIGHCLEDLKTRWLDGGLTADKDALTEQARLWIQGN